MKNFTVVVALLALATGCKKEEAPTKRDVPTNAQKTATAPGPAPAEERTTPGVTIPAGSYEIDAGHSVLLWKVRHLGAGYTYGWFRDYSGKVLVDADPAKQSIELVAKVDSIDSRDAKRDDHLKGPDFFNATQFPTITYKSTKIEAGQNGALNVTGDLTIHGVTKPVTSVVSPTGTGKNTWDNSTLAGWETTLKINRMDFGMTFMPEALGTEIELIIGIEAVMKN